jgi:hypothetical protein
VILSNTACALDRYLGKEVIAHVDVKLAQSSVWSSEAGDDLHQRWAQTDFAALAPSSCPSVKYAGATVLAPGGEGSNRAASEADGYTGLPGKEPVYA